jgi:hypothetical protein
MKGRIFLLMTCFSLLTSALHGTVRAQAPVELSPAQAAQAQASVQGRYSLFVFHRDDAEATQAMKQAVAELAVKRPTEVATIHVRITEPGEAALVKQFNVSRAPMPLVIAVAPNGAVTGAYPQRVTAEQLATSFVTPAMTHCMKSMQQGRLVLLCVQAAPQAGVPAAVGEFLADPQFKDRSDVVAVQSADPAEAQLLKELGVNLLDPNGASVVFFAPPGVLVGKFTSSSTKADMAAALHKAGKCCDDPNCKHGHAHQPKSGTVR